MIRITLLLALVLSAPAARADWCEGIVTSSGTCIGSQGNTDPPAIYCDEDGGGDLPIMS
jgi:hypothetical protein